jgi:hypothetical protein
VLDYISKPVNQKSKLPSYIDATRVKENREQMRPFKVKIKYVDTTLAVLNSIVVIILCREVCFC